MSTQACDKTSSGSASSPSSLRLELGDVATSLSYLSLEGLQDAIGLPAELFTREGFTCEYPVPVPEQPEMEKLRFGRGAA